jgi:hypothetical protein
VLTIVGGRVVFDAGQAEHIGGKNEPATADSRDGR